MQEKKDSNKLQLIPKIEKYMEYMMHVIIKLPRVEKFSIGTEYKKSMYNMMSGVVKIAKIDDKDKCLSELNTIDAELNMQRIYLRIMVKEKWIDYKKFQVSMDQIYEIGKILEGLIKYYAKNIKKWIW